jgi:hypothetical protein
VTRVRNATEATPGNAGDASAAEALLVDVLSLSTKQEGAPSDGVVVDSADPAAPVEVFGDSSYGTAELVDKIVAAGALACAASCVSGMTTRSMPRHTILRDRPGSARTSTGRLGRALRRRRDARGVSGRQVPRKKAEAARRVPGTTGGAEDPPDASTPRQHRKACSTPAS